jgi:uncharacterized protein involved in high-affinity Fe2+ transport
MRKFVIVATVLSIGLILPRGGWGQGERARVGARTVGHLEIALYVWGPQEVVHPKGAGHAEPAAPATHHLDVRVYDLHRAVYIPYLNITATISDQTKKRDVTVELAPMLGEWLHYGANVALPHPGKYSLLIDVRPPDIARYKHLADVWSAPAQAVFTYEVR